MRNADCGLQIEFLICITFFQSETGNPPEGWESAGQIRNPQSELPLLHNSMALGALSSLATWIKIPRNVKLLVAEVLPL